MQNQNQKPVVLEVRDFLKNFMPSGAYEKVEKLLDGAVNEYAKLQSKQEHINQALIKLFGTLDLDNRNPTTIAQIKAAIRLVVNAPNDDALDAVCKEIIKDGGAEREKAKAAFYFASLKAIEEEAYKIGYSMEAGGAILAIRAILKDVENDIDAQSFISTYYGLRGTLAVKDMEITRLLDENTALRRNYAELEKTALDADRNLREELSSNANLAQRLADAEQRIEVLTASRDFREEVIITLHTCIGDGEEKIKDVLEYPFYTNDIGDARDKIEMYRKVLVSLGVKLSAALKDRQVKKYFRDTRGVSPIVEIFAENNASERLSQGLNEILNAARCVEIPQDSRTKKDYNHKYETPFTTGVDKAAEGKDKTSISIHFEGEGLRWEDIPDLLIEGFKRERELFASKSRESDNETFEKLFKYPWGG